MFQVNVVAASQFYSQVYNFHAWRKVDDSKSEKRLLSNFPTTLLPRPMHDWKMLLGSRALTHCLDLETTAFSATTSAFELATRRANVWLDGIVGVHRVDGGRVAEVLVHLTGGAATTKEHSVGTLWRAKSQLVEAEAFATGRSDTGTSGLSEVERHDRHLWHVQETDVVRHGTHDNSELAFVSLHVASHTSDRQWGLVRVRLIQTTQHNAVELRVGTASEKAVETHKQVEVHILGLWGRAVFLTDDLATGNQIDTLLQQNDTQMSKCGANRDRAERRRSLPTERQKTTGDGRWRVPQCSEEPVSPLCTTGVELSWSSQKELLVSVWFRNLDR